MSISGKDLLLFWRTHFTKNSKNTERGKKIEIRVNLLPKYGCRRRDRPVLVTQMIQSFMVSMRWRESSSLNIEDCEEPSLVQTDEENSDFDAKRLYCSGLCTRDRRGENWINAQNATSGAMNSVRVRTTGKCFFDFSATLYKYSARLTQLHC
jgi:hypothetical protein